ncbi:DUF1819 family protein [Methylomonas sp. MS20]|uniref:DUF1819 family protein n=1 Tax=Methylomonas sp. MS20 TaxID=3418769 RepID=UPI003D00CC28
MAKERYCMSFTTGGLFHHESVKIASLYLEFRDWEVTRDEVIRENVLQARALNTSKRVCREVISRLKTLSLNELSFLVKADRQNQAYLLWVAICRRYQFIADFAVEVIRERFLSLKADLNPIEFDTFYNRKSEWHQELDKIQPSTRGKLRQVLFKMLKEANLLTEKQVINAAMLSPELKALISQSTGQECMVLPTLEINFKESDSD